MPVGYKTGGRQRGTPNKKTKETIEAAASKWGMLPIDYMMTVMNDPEAEAHRRDDMAKAAAPYFHGKVTGEGGITMNVSDSGSMPINGKGNGAEDGGIVVRFVRPNNRASDG